VFGLLTVHQPSSHFMSLGVHSQVKLNSCFSRYSMVFRQHIDSLFAMAVITWSAASVDFGGIHGSFSIMLNIGGKPLSTFAEPLGVLCDCHRRVEHFLGTLLRVSQLEPGQGLNDAQREALEGALRYFREAAPRHTQDEEASLFPRMKCVKSAKAQAACATQDQLIEDHRRAQPDHELVDELGREWLRTGALAAGQLAAMRQALQRLDTMYQSHIQLEDSQVFPLAGEVLEAEELQRVGQEMAARRGVEFKPKDSCPGA
jgi:hemerythrin-like domain-containing protein